MTATDKAPEKTLRDGAGAPPQGSADNMVTLTIDGVEVSVPKGTLVIRAAEQVGIADPAVLRPPAARPGRRLPPVPGRHPRRRQRPRLPQAAGLVHARGRRGHGGQHPGHPPGRRQGAAGHHGVPADQPPARLPGLRQGRRVPAAEPGDDQRPRRVPVHEIKRTFPKPINISAQVLLDRERCVLCARCTRFSEQIAGDPFIALIERGALQQVGHLREGALRVLLLRQHDPDLPGRRADLAPTTASARGPFDLVSTPVDRRARRLRLGDPRRPPPRQGHAPPGRRRPRGQRGVDHRQGPLRVHATPRSRTGSTYPLVRDDGDRRAAPGLAGPRRSPSRPAAWRPRAGGVGVLTGGRLTAEDAYAYAKFARVALGTNDIDFRARAALRRGGRVPRRRTSPLHRPGRDVRRPRERARRRARRPRARGRGRHGLPAAAQGGPRGRHAASVRSRRTPRAACARWPARSIRPRPAPRPRRSRWPTTREHGSTGRRDPGRRAARRRARRPQPPCRAAGRDAPAPGSAWVPRRAGDRGAVEAGCLPNLLPGGRPRGRRRGARRPRRRLGRASAAPPRRPRRQRDRRGRSPPATSAASSSAASTPTTWPTRPLAARRSTPPASWSASSCARPT